MGSTLISMLRPPFQGLVGRRPTNLETRPISAISPSRGRYETPIFPTLKGSFQGQKSDHKPHLGLLFHDFSNHCNLLPWPDPGHSRKECLLAGRTVGTQPQILGRADLSTLMGYKAG